MELTCNKIQCVDFVAKSISEDMTEELDVVLQNGKLCLADMTYVWEFSFPQLNMPIFLYFSNLHKKSMTKKYEKFTENKNCICLTVFSL